MQAALRFIAEGFALAGLSLYGCPAFYWKAEFVGDATGWW
jgi:hypothetical protein